MEVDAQSDYAVDLFHLSVHNKAIDTSGMGEKQLAEETARACAFLVTQLQGLSAAVNRNDDFGRIVGLPDAVTVLPRQRPPPKPKAETKWDKFKREKGITSTKKKGKLKWDEDLNRWVPRFGQKKREADAQRNWLVELPSNYEMKTATGDPWSDMRVAKNERVSKQKMQQQKNKDRAAGIRSHKGKLATRSNGAFDA